MISTLFHFLEEAISFVGSFVVGLLLSLGIGDSRPETYYAPPDVPLDVITGEETGNSAMDDTEEMSMVEDEPAENLTPEPEEAPQGSVIPEEPSVFLPPTSTNTETAEELNTRLRESLFNFLCIANSSPVSSITGSAVMINEQGVLITNAHLGQYLLIEKHLGEEKLDCILRHGSPAEPTYEIELLFISPDWIREHASAITEETPEGTGENDFALLLVTEVIDKDQELPKTFPAFDFDLNDLYTNIDVPVFMGAYPAGFLGGESIQKELYAVTTESFIADLFTFKDYTKDLIKIDGNILSQRGSSGGAVANMNTGNLIGLIVTTTQEETTGERSLNAITFSHIDRSLFETLGEHISSYLEGDLSRKAAIFEAEIGGTLRELLIQEIQK